MKVTATLLVLFLLVSCAAVLVQHEFDSTATLDEDQYGSHGAEKGLVLVSANWDRAWSCGGFENAELRSIGFDLLPMRKSDDTQPPDIVLNGSHKGRGYTNYALLVEPGQYGISHVKIKIAESMNQVRYLGAYRSRLFRDGKPLGGTFEVAAGEVVYIGHFGLDCAQEPILWRYYLENRRDFNDYLAGYRREYPYLKLDDVRYRLFSTDEFGYEFRLQ